jgi:hypothetical protein
MDIQSAQLWQFHATYPNCWIWYLINHYLNSKVRWTNFDPVQCYHVSKIKKYVWLIYLWIITWVHVIETRTIGSNQYWTVCANVTLGARASCDRKDTTRRLWSHEHPASLWWIQYLNSVCDWSKFIRVFSLVNLWASVNQWKDSHRMQLSKK